MGVRTLQISQQHRQQQREHNGTKPSQPQVTTQLRILHQANDDKSMDNKEDILILGKNESLLHFLNNLLRGCSTDTMLRKGKPLDPGHRNKEENERKPIVMTVQQLRQRPMLREEGTRWPQKTSSREEVQFTS